MKLMYTGQSRNGKIVPAERDQRPDRPQAAVRDRREQRHRVRLPHREHRQVRVEPPVARAPAHVRPEAQVVRDRVDVERVGDDADRGARPSSAIITPRRTFPRTSPAMYAEYWKPMNWKSRIESMNGNTVVEKMSLRKLWLLPAQEVGLAGRGDLRGRDAVGVLRQVRSKLERLVARRPKMNIAMKLATPKPASAVTTLWNVRVGRHAHDPDHARARRASAMKPGTPGDRAGRVGEPGVRVLEEVPAGPDPDDARRDLEVAQDERDLEGDDQDRRDHERPRLHPAEERMDDAAREHVVAAGARHHGGERREDQRQHGAEEARDDRGPGVLRDAAELPHGHEREGVEDRIERQSDADERGDVEEERVRHAHVAHEPRGLADEQLGASCGRSGRSFRHDRSPNPRVDDVHPS